MVRTKCRQEEASHHQGRTSLAIWQIQWSMQACYLLRASTRRRFRNYSSQIRLSTLIHHLLNRAVQWRLNISRGKLDLQDNSKIRWQQISWKLWTSWRASGLQKWQTWPSRKVIGNKAWVRVGKSSQGPHYWNQRVRHRRQIFSHQPLRSGSSRPRNYKGIPTQL